MTLSSIRRVTRERDKESALSQFSRKLPEIPDAAFQQQKCDSMPKNTILRAKNVTFQTIKESLSQSFTSFAALCLCIIIETLKMRHGNALKMNGAQLLTCVPSSILARTLNSNLIIIKCLKML